MGLRVIVGAGLVLGAFAVVAVVAYFGNQELYLTVDELVSSRTLYVLGDRSQPGADGPGRRVQVRGVVDDMSVWRPADGLELRFTLMGDAHRLPVRYRGMVPDTFDQAETITVGGVVGPFGTFMADNLTVQCPSKYEAELPGAPTKPAGGARADPALPVDDG
jgi:cytochrome c-type biogenesis protein CcmE